LTLPLAFLRGFGFCGLALTLGVLQDFRAARIGLPHFGFPHFGLMAMTGVGLVYGGIAVVYAWRWAGLQGPANRLTSRACGVALGSAVPAIIASHALYFHWVNSVEAACGQGLLHLFELAFRR
jgi:hypothetical protein